jgi:hypothetical protein
MTASEVADLIASLRSGSMTLDDVAARFRQRTWSRTRPTEPQNYIELAAQAQLDPRTHLAGSFDDVLAAYDRGELTREQYRTLAEAVADSIRAEYDAAESGDESGAHE